MFTKFGVKVSSLTNESKRSNEKINNYRKKLPEMFICSHLTTRTLWPVRAALATIVANRPIRCSRASIIIGCKKMRHFMNIIIFKAQMSILNIKQT